MGAASGIGRAAAQHLAREGARVFQRESNKFAAALDRWPVIEFVAHGNAPLNQPIGSRQDGLCGLVEVKAQNYGIVEVNFHRRRSFKSELTAETARRGLTPFSLKTSLTGRTASMMRTVAAETGKILATG